METIISTSDGQRLETRPGAQSSDSAVAWGAVIAGAVTGMAVSLILLLLGSALGMAAVSPWSHEGVSATTFTATAAIWLIVMQWVSSGFGGYLTGRLRSKWVSLHDDEVFFRDTAHGFLSWALMTVVIVTFLTSTIASIAGGGVGAAATVAGIAAADNTGAIAGSVSEVARAPDAYLVDTLFRSGDPAQQSSSQTQPVAPMQQDAQDDISGTVNQPDAQDTPEMPALPSPPMSMTYASNASPATPETRAEASRILLTQITGGAISPADKAYLVQLVSSRAGVSQTEAAKRVDAAIASIEDAKLNAKLTADEARKVSASFSIYAFLSLLIGAFIASAAAALGGTHRDEF